ncbi:hypothetical protein H4R35_003102 [Dimargaris xerosporica]|nr:hypothetical protein H4R35_003102 [Dimargaris xerosporica]
MSSALRLLTLFTSKTCPLCWEAKQTLVDLQKQIPFNLEEVDIHARENATEWQKYTFDIPVLHIDHRFAMQHRIDGAKLLAMLNRPSENNHQ